MVGSWPAELSKLSQNLTLNCCVRRIRIADWSESAYSPTSHSSVLLDLSGFVAEHCKKMWSLYGEWNVGFGWGLRNSFVVFLCIFESTVVPISSFLVIAYWQAAIKQDVTMALHFHFGSSSLGTAYCFLLPIEKTVFHRRNKKTPKNKPQIFLCYFSWWDSSKHLFLWQHLCQSWLFRKNCFFKDICSEGAGQSLVVMGIGGYPSLKDVSCTALEWKF